MDRDGGQERALVLYDEGRAAMKRGDLHTAAAKLRASVRLMPTGPSLAALGESLLGLYLDAEAVVHLSAALGMGERDVSVRSMLAVGLRRVGDRAESLRLLRAAYAERPSDPGLLDELKR